MYLSYSEDEQDILDMYLEDSDDELIIKFCNTLKRVTFDETKNQIHLFKDPIALLKQSKTAKTLKSILKSK